MKKMYALLLRNIDVVDIAKEIEELLLSVDFLLLLLDGWLRFDGQERGNSCVMGLSLSFRACQPILESDLRALVQGARLVPKLLTQ